MIVRHKKLFLLGLILSVAFLIVLSYMFTPNFNGTNAFHASDNLFNSISKGSTYYIPQVAEDAKLFDGKQFQTTIFEDETRFIPYAKTILMKNGLKITDTAKGILVSGDLGSLMARVLEDADAMFKNAGPTLSNKYAMDEKQAMYVWWKTMKEIKSALDQQKSFRAAVFIDKNIIKRAIEVGYNYYGIEGQDAAHRWGILLFSLLFYVVYTLWWGYGIFFMCEGLGLEMKAGKKQEM